MCGDWNLNFMVENRRIQEVNNLLESYNLINIVHQQELPPHRYPR
jgi:hypothetical protein